LIIGCSSPGQQFPVDWPRSHVESARVKNGEAALFLVEICHLGESYVITNADPDLAIGLK